jgi:hypothetical protein
MDRLDVSKKVGEGEEQKSMLGIAQSHQILWQHRFDYRSQ